MSRPYLVVMTDLAKAHEGYRYTIVREDQWPELIEDLAEADDDQYVAALALIRTFAKIVETGRRFLQ